MDGWMDDMLMILLSLTSLLNGEEEVCEKKG
jgi:hypothetical protein